MCASLYLHFHTEYTKFDKINGESAFAEIESISLYEWDGWMDDVEEEAEEEQVQGVV